MKIKKLSEIAKIDISGVDKKTNPGEKPVKLCNFTDVYYNWSDVSPYTEIIKEYERIQYNCIFDQKNIDTDIFFLEGYVHEASDLTREESND